MDWTLQQNDLIDQCELMGADVRSEGDNKDNEDVNITCIEIKPVDGSKDAEVLSQCLEIKSEFQPNKCLSEGISSKDIFISIPTPGTESENSDSQLMKSKPDYNDSELITIYTESKYSMFDRESLSMKSEDIDTNLMIEPDYSDLKNSSIVESDNSVAKYSKLRGIANTSDYIDPVSYNRTLLPELEIKTKKPKLENVNYFSSRSSRSKQQYEVKLLVRPCYVKLTRLAYSDILNRPVASLHQAEVNGNCKKERNSSVRRIYTGGLKSNIRKRAKQKLFSCAECGKTYTRQENLKSHKMTHHGGNLFSCAICSKTFTFKCNLVRHSLLHSDIKPFSCTVCDESFRRRSALLVHQEIHSGEKRYTCGECGKQFYHPYILKEHQRYHSKIKFVHSNKGQFVCAECGKWFHFRYLLKQHELVHTGGKPFSCSECGKFFARRRYLSNHLLIHADEKPFSCTECGKRYTSRCNLKRHQLSHSPIKKYCCNLCGRGFYREDLLKLHQLKKGKHLSWDEKKHSLVKPHTCNDCGNKYAYLVTLRRHRKLKHSDKI